MNAPTNPNATNRYERLRIADQLIQFDRSATRNAYRKITTSGSKECGCSGCRNYIAQRDTAYPSSFLSLLDNLGIDSGKEGEVYYIGPDASGKRLYGGWFFFCGELIQSGEGQFTEDEVSYSVIGPGRMPSLFPPDSFGQHPLALDFYIKLPWVLDSRDDPDQGATRITPEVTNGD